MAPSGTLGLKIWLSSHAWRCYLPGRGQTFVVGREIVNQLKQPKNTSFVREAASEQVNYVTAAGSSAQHSDRPNTSTNLSAAKGGGVRPFHLSGCSGEAGG